MCILGAEIFIIQKHVVIIGMIAGRQRSNKRLNELRTFDVILSMFKDSKQMQINNLSISISYLL